MKARVTAAGYLGFTAPDLDAWRRYASEVLGAQISPSSTDEMLRVRIDDRDWRFSVHPGQGGLSYMGWEVPNAAVLDAVADNLAALGFEAKEDPDLAKTREVQGLLLTEDPVGNQVEIFYGAFMPGSRFVSPLGVDFVTTAELAGDMGFGHFDILISDRYEEMVHFYIDGLGCRVSDTMSGPDGEDGGVFLHVNQRHHSLGILKAPGIETQMGHFMVEVADLDTVGQGYDRSVDHGAKTVLTIGKHTNDHMVSFYMESPSGFAVEYGTGGRLITSDEWLVSHYHEDSYWGHRTPGKQQVFA
ncbi:2,3-dihydroxybiphenyl 1,2-dioxygenase [Streptomyces fuscichromogenes]|uniref:2,3-dihydroxybiphenyl 1,2-dioxygenase n=2 Tax=Streptomyces fuscichromogenes TaxID=1324013 RepID=A0A917XMD1_9ACTN|nr:2,3-dihydroxybiphenyl 1,2-dioxygenase [Streptomyces fuscichromogenes]